MVELRLFELAHRAGPSINSAFFSPRHSMVNRSPRREWKVIFLKMRSSIARLFKIARQSVYLFVLGGVFIFRNFPLADILVRGIDVLN